MIADRLTLRPLRADDEASFKAAVDEFQNEVPPWQFAFHFDPKDDFSHSVAKLERWSRGIDLPENSVPNTYYVGIVDEKVVGRLSLRHCLNDLRLFGGHIGYGGVPSQRRKGYAKAMLRKTLPICEELGIEKALVSCDTDHLASRKVIESCGGIFDRVTAYPDLEKQKRIYWVQPTIARSVGGT